MHHFKRNMSDTLTDSLKCFAKYLEFAVSEH